MRMQTSRRRAAFAILLAVGAAALAGCSNGSPAGDAASPGATGTLRMSLTDAPYPFDLIDQAMLTIDQVSVHFADVPDDTTGGTDGFLVVDGTTRTVNLLDLRNGLTEPLVDAEVPVGTIDQIRLHVTDASVTLTDGRQFDLKVPSGETSGLKAFPEPGIAVVGDLSTDLLLDVDVSRSFLAIPAAPNRASDIRGFHFHPVVRVANLSDTGSISGVVTGDAGTPADLSDDAPISGATVTAVAGDGTSTSTATDVDGKYTFLGLPVGGYTLTASAANHDPLDLSVTVVAANAVGGADFLLAETSGPAPSTSADATAEAR